MKQEKIAQDKKRETSRIIGEVETMREDSKKLLSPKGAIVFSEQLAREPTSAALNNTHPCDILRLFRTFWDRKRRGESPLHNQNSEQGAENKQPAL